MLPQPDWAVIAAQVQATASTLSASSQTTTSGSADTQQISPTSSRQQTIGSKPSSTPPNTAAQQQPISSPGYIYWCVDGCWQQPKRIRRSVIDANMDDRSFFNRLVKDYHEFRGLRARFFSLRGCVKVEFIKFAPVSSRQAEICRIREQLPPQGDQCAACTPHCAHSYDFEKAPFHDDEVHRAVAATEIITGMRDPNWTNRRDDVRRKVPAHRMQTVPNLDHDVGPPGWGIHAVQGWDQFKVVCWLAFLTVVMVLFVICWLTFVNKTDVSGAFAGATFLATMIAVILALPQILVKD